MSPHIWTRNLTSLCHQWSRPAWGEHRQRPNRTRWSAVPRLEWLEDRLALSGSYPLGTSLFFFNTGTYPTRTGTVTYLFTGSELANLSVPAGWTKVGQDTWQDTVILTATESVANSASTGPLPAGTDYTVSLQNISGTTDQFTINQGNSSVSTAIYDTTGGTVTGAPGEKVYDTATVTGTPFTPTGTVTYYFYNTASPVYETTPPVSTETVVLSGGDVPNSVTTTAPAPGSYAYLAVYSGDSNYADSISAVEQLTIPKPTPSINTTPSPTGVTLGTSSVTLKDTAVLSGSYSPTGTITFTLYQGMPLVDMETVTVNGNGNYSTPIGYTLPTTDIVTGTYQWDASYSGDSNNNPASDNNAANEQVTVNPASPTLRTTASGNIRLGTTAPIITDSAVLTDGYHPDGSITFTLTLNGTAVSAATLTVPVTYNSTTSTYGARASYTLSTSGTVAGTYVWSASYRPDGNNNGTSEMGNAHNGEQTVVNPASPGISTAIDNAATYQPIRGNQPPNTSVDDTATVTGTPFMPTGTVTYYFYNTATPIYGTTTPVHTQTVTLTSSGAVPNSSPTGPLTSGSDAFIAVYSGDSNNTGHVGAVQPLTVNPAPTPTPVVTSSTPNLPAKPVPSFNGPGSPIPSGSPLVLNTNPSPPLPGGAVTSIPGVSNLEGTAVATTFVTGPNLLTVDPTESNSPAKGSPRALNARKQAPFEGPSWREGLPLRLGSSLLESDDSVGLVEAILRALRLGVIPLRSRWSQRRKNPSETTWVPSGRKPSYHRLPWNRTCHRLLQVLPDGAGKWFPQSS